VMTLPEGVEIDLDRRTLTILGEPMVVGAALIDDDAEEREKSWMFSLLCGENGWWIDLYVWPDNGEMEAHPCYWVCDDLDLSAQRALHPIAASPVEALDLFRAYSSCRVAPDLGDYLSPFYGLVPGTWLC
jgi:hypothetical protein